MKTRTRRVASMLVAPLVLAVLAISCSSPPGTAAPCGSSFRFRANKVTVVNHNDSFLYGVRDEPFVYNLWFRVKVGVPGLGPGGPGRRPRQRVQRPGRRPEPRAHRRRDGRGQVRQRPAAGRAGPGQPLQRPGDRRHLDVGHGAGRRERGRGGQRHPRRGPERPERHRCRRHACRATPTSWSTSSSTTSATPCRCIAGALFGSIPGIPDDADRQQLLRGRGLQGLPRHHRRRSQRPA